MASLPESCHASKVLAQDKLIGEQWGRFPASRAKLLALLHVTQTPVVLLSGDVHLAEVSRLQCGFAAFPFWEVTSSGLTHSWAGPREWIIHWLSDGRERVGQSYLGLNAGVLELQCEGATDRGETGGDCTPDTATLAARVVDEHGRAQLSQRWPLAQLQPGSLLDNDPNLLACAQSDPHQGLAEACKQVLAQCSPSMTAERQQWALVRSYLLLAFLTLVLAYVVSMTCLLACGSAYAKPKVVQLVVVPLLAGWLLRLALNR